MQVRHAKPGDEAQFAFLLEDHERHYGNPVAEGSGAAGASFLTSAPPGGTMCLVAERDGRTTGEGNSGSQRFYDRLGMRREKKVYYAMDP